MQHNKGKKINNLIELVKYIDKNDYIYYDDVIVTVSWIKEQTIIDLYNKIQQDSIYEVDSVDSNISKKDNKKIADDGEKENE